MGIQVNWDMYVRTWQAEALAVVPGVSPTQCQCPHTVTDASAHRMLQGP